MAPAMAEAAAHTPIALPRAAPSEVEPRIARLLGSSSAAPTPWTPRPANRLARLGARAAPAEPTANSATPAISIRRGPNRSPSAPPSSRSALSGNK
jgi:hypothetical protein